MFMERTKQILTGSIISLLLAPVSAHAIPNLGSITKPRPQNRVEDPREVVAAGFASLLDRELNREEVQQIGYALSEIESVPEKPIRVGYLGDLWDRYEKLPIICLYGKLNAKIPDFIPNFKIHGTAASYEITPCLMLNSFNPFALRLSEFKSYIMQGGSFAQTGGKFGGLAGGILAGLYAGPKHLARPIIGTYGFLRGTYDHKAVKWVGQFAVSGDGQVMALAGVGAELSFDVLIDLLKRPMPRPTIEGLNLGKPVPGKGEMGMYFDVREFPWFERMVLKGMTPVETFADMSQYLAANKLN